MKRICVTAFLVLEFLASRLSLAADSADTCRDLLPTTLQSAVKARYPSDELPLATKNLEVDRDYNRSRGGSGCLRVATGDFDGDGRKDFVFLLSPATKAAATSLIVALSRPRGVWSLKELGRWKQPAERLFVETLGPGRYQRSESVADPLEKAEVDKIDSKRDGVLFGKVESFEIGYFLPGKRWVHIRLAD